MNHSIFCFMLKYYDCYISFKGDYKIQPLSCMSVRLKALRPGFTQLTVTYQYKDILLKAAVTIGAYLPLQVNDIELPPQLIELILGKKDSKSYRNTARKKKNN